MEEKNQIQYKDYIIEVAEDKSSTSLPYYKIFFILPNKKWLRIRAIEGYKSAEQALQKAKTYIDNFEPQIKEKIQKSIESIQPEFAVREVIREKISSMFDEERIPNPEADEFIQNRENFIGSHTYGEDIGNLGKLYVAYSYGEQHPLYAWIDKNEFKELRPHEAKLAADLKEEERGMHFINDTFLNEKDDENGGWTDSQGITHKKRSEHGVWFYNESPYYVKNAKGKTKPNKWTYKHLRDLKPNEKIQARNILYLKRLISDFKQKHKIGANTHDDLVPGEK